MALIYLDNSALMRWAEGDISTPSTRNQAGRSRVEALLEDDAAALGISEHTLLEYAGSLAGDRFHTEKPEFDAEWQERGFFGVMREIDRGRLVMVPVPPKASEHAMMLLGLAARDHEISFKVWDAIHLITAAAWAVRERERVAILTSDSDFRRFLDRYPYFGRFVDVDQLE